MTNILEEIIQYKYKEVETRKALRSVKKLESSALFESKIFSLKESLLRKDNSGVIAEFKRKSPSKGMINNNADVASITCGYVKAGASALSILTDEKYFGGSENDLLAAREINQCPILRKEFIVDEYQIIEAKSIGADAILLIAACLSKKEIDQFAKFARSLNLEVLLELHGEDEFDKISQEVELIGINNRNLKTFIVDIEQSKRYASKIPGSFIKIAESGIDSQSIIKDLKQSGFRGFLMGEHFMKTSDPAKACAEFIKLMTND
jgi:indole-3-glycerol phosphate synthase